MIQKCVSVSGNKQSSHVGVRNVIGQGGETVQENLLALDIDSLSRMIRAREISPVTVTEMVLRRISEVNPVLNAFICVTAESALEQARERESEVLKGEYRGPLHGIPVAIKDIFATKGQVTTAGSRILGDWIPDYDATVVTRLKESGAILIGKTNLHEFAMGATTENPHYGPCRNPWDPRRISGGSSGGSAVAVATGMAYAALGTDTAGSIRLPSALCGVVGLKPTYGRVSRHGVLPLSWSLDHVGPITRTVKDAAYLLEALAGPDLNDPSCSWLDSEPYPSLLKPMKGRPLEGLRIGIIRKYFFEDIDSEIIHTVSREIATMAELGAKVIEVSVPLLEEAAVAQRAISQVEGYAYHELYFRRNPQLYGEDVQFRLNIGHSIPGYQYVNAHRVRRMFQASFLRVFRDCDVVVSPTNAKSPFLVGEVRPEETVNNMFALGKTALCNLLGFPALSLPCGLTPEGLPIGLQWIGRPFGEAALLTAAYAYEQSTSWNKHLIRTCISRDYLMDL